MANQKTQSAPFSFTTLVKQQIISLPRPIFRSSVQPDLLALRLFPRTIGLKGLSLIVRKNSCRTRSPTLLLGSGGHPGVPHSVTLQVTISNSPGPDLCGPLYENRPLLVNFNKDVAIHKIWLLALYSFSVSI